MLHQDQNDGRSEPTADPADRRDSRARGGFRRALIVLLLLGLATPFGALADAPTLEQLDSRIQRSLAALDNPDLTHHLLVVHTRP